MQPTTRPRTLDSKRLGKPHDRVGTSQQRTLVMLFAVVHTQPLLIHGYTPRLTRSPLRHD